MLLNLPFRHFISCETIILLVCGPECLFMLAFIFIFVSFRFFLVSNHLFSPLGRQLRSVYAQLHQKSPQK